MDFIEISLRFVFVFFMVFNHTSGLEFKGICICMKLERRLVFILSKRVFAKPGPLSGISKIEVTTIAIKVCLYIFIKSLFSQLLDFLYLLIFYLYIFQAFPTYTLYILYNYWLNIYKFIYDLF